MLRLLKQRLQMVVVARSELSVDDFKCFTNSVVLLGQSSVTSEQCIVNSLAQDYFVKGISFLCVQVKTPLVR